MAKLSPIATIFISLFLISFAGMLIAVVVPVRELFGAQGGEMVQLATSHVPDASDWYAMQQEAQQRKKEIIDMTGYW
jgi:uncharacterized membrane protein